MTPTRNNAGHLIAPPATLLGAIRRDPTSEIAWLAFSEWLKATHGAPAAAQEINRAVATVRNPAPLLEAISRLLASTPSAPLRISALNRLAQLQPQNAHVLADLARALLDTAAATAARKPLRAALDNGATAHDLKLALASLEAASGEFARADALYRDVLAGEPSNTVAWAGLFFNALQELRWTDAAHAAERTRQEIAKRGSARGIPNHQLLMLYGDEPPAPLYGDFRLPPPQPRRRPSNRRVRIGYLSSDLQTHATAILIAGLFEAHDRERFEVFGYSYGPRTSDPYRERMQKSLEHWCDLNDLDDAAAAARIAADQIDFLIELKGHTQGARLGITARRPAPVQIHYLGYPGPIGGYGIDYFLADWDTVPAQGEAEFPETVLRLPRCYQVNDAKRHLPQAASRADYGFENDHLILANFNQTWKLGERFVAIWARALARSPRTRLWLLDPGETGRRQLLACAAYHGVDEPENAIRFAQRIDPQQHINRLALADLALDQLPCSSHTTAADALWAGVPVLTMYGNRFAGRVGAGLVRAIDEKDFIADSLDDYEMRLNALIDNPGELKRAKKRIESKRVSAPLWHTAAFTRDLETTLMSLLD